MAQDVKAYVEKCDDCQRNKISKYTKLPMQRTDTQGVPWEKVASDLVGPINPPAAAGYKYILTIRCLFSKYTQAIPLKTQSAEEVAKELMNVLCTYGIPEKILTDQGTNFMSKVFQELCKGFVIKTIKSTAYHPQSNGSLERFHRDLKTYLRIFTNSSTEWNELLATACFVHNTSVVRSTGFTPFSLMYMRDPNIPTSFKIGKNTVVYNPDDYVKVVKHNMREAYKLARENLDKTKEITKNSYDKNLNVVNFKIGDKILVLNESKKITRNSKFSDEWIGPYTILDDLGNNLFKVKIGRKITNIHGDKLKIYKD
jgi:hypothetical protein